MKNQVAIGLQGFIRSQISIVKRLIMDILQFFGICSLRAASLDDLPDDAHRSFHVGAGDDQASEY